MASSKKPSFAKHEKHATNNWASRLQKVTTGENNNPIDEYLEGQVPANVKTNKDLIFTLQKKNAEYAAINQKRVEKRSRVLEEAGQLRPELQDRGAVGARGFKPTFGQLKQVKEVRGTDVVDDRGRDYLTKFVKPVAETTEDAGPVRIEMKGSKCMNNA